MGDSVLLDPYDVCRLSRGLRKIPEELIGSVLELGISDGNVLPHLAMRGTEEKCVYVESIGLDYKRKKWPEKTENVIGIISK